MKRSIVLLVLALASFGLAAPAQASSGAIVVTGVQTPVLSCEGQTRVAAYEMTGGLLGCWYIDEITSETYHPSGTAVFTGTETFIGCVDADGDAECDGDWGEFQTTFKFTAKYTSDFSAELHGRCHHPITTGSGVFENAKGLINFTDNVDDGTADYSGPISL